jgi:hypothetical protein
VENGITIKSALGVTQEILDRDRLMLVMQLHLHIPEGGAEGHQQAGTEGTTD